MNVLIKTNVQYKDRERETDRHWDRGLREREN